MKKFIFIIFIIGTGFCSDTKNKIEKAIIFDLNNAAEEYSDLKSAERKMLYSSILLTLISGNLVPDYVAPEFAMLPVFTLSSAVYVKKYLELKNFSWLKIDQFNNNIAKDVDSVTYIKTYIDKLAIYAANSAIKAYENRNNFYLFEVIPIYMISALILTQMPLELGWMVAYYGGYSLIKSIASWNFFNTFQKSKGYTKNLIDENKAYFLSIYQKEVKMLADKNNINVSSDRYKKIFANVGLIGCVYIAIIIQLAYDSIVWG